MKSPSAAVADRPNITAEPIDPGANSRILSNIPVDAVTGPVVRMLTIARPMASITGGPTVTPATTEDVHIS